MDQRNNYSEERPFPLLGILYKRWLLITMITVLCVLIGLFYGLITVRPTYTASRSVILRMSVEEGTEKDNIITNVSLARIYIDDISDMLSAPEMVKRADADYKADGGVYGSIVSGAIGVSYDLQSLIFKISYTDISKAAAVEKLESLIASASEELPEIVEAASISLIPTQHESDVNVSNGLARYPIIGGVLGLIISVAIVVLIYALDNTIKDRREFEELTGVYVLSHIDEIVEKEEKEQ